MTTVDLPAITRPDGRLYRPRKVIACSWEDDTVHGWSGGAVVLGTHDVERARVLADSSVKLWFGSELSALEPKVGWYRLAIERNEQTWTEDARRGRAGVWFTAKEVIAVANGKSDAEGFEDALDAEQAEQEAGK